MPVEEQQSEINNPFTEPINHKPSFVEVICTSSGKTRRFAAGTEASFALLVINRKLEAGPRVWHIEAVKEGEEPIIFGPNSVLVEYGDGWRLRTVSEPEGFWPKEAPFSRSTLSRPPSDIKVLTPGKPATSPLKIDFSYIGKILLAFVLIFVMGAALTFALENLPRLILYVNSL